MLTQPECNNRPQYSQERAFQSYLDLGCPKWQCQGDNGGLTFTSAAQLRKTRSPFDQYRKSECHMWIAHCQQDLYDLADWNLRSCQKTPLMINHKETVLGPFSIFQLMLVIAICLAIETVSHAVVILASPSMDQPIREVEVLKKCDGQRSG